MMCVFIFYKFILKCVKRILSLFNLFLLITLSVHHILSTIVSYLFLSK